VEGLKFFIGDKQYNGFEIVKLALDFGSQHKPQKITDMHSTIMLSVTHLRCKGVPVKVLLPSGDEMIGIPGDPADGIATKTDTKLLEAKVDEDEMIVLFGDGVYRVDPMYLSNECWDVQLFGNPGCFGCPDKNKVTCWGEDVIKNGHNTYGSTVPLAFRMGDRPKREKEVKK